MNEQEKPMEQVGMDEAVAAEIERRVREEVQRARAEWEAEQVQADAERERVTDFMVVLKHTLRNALIPVITYVGPMIAYILTGSMVVETVFNIGGLGTKFVSAINNQDYPMIMGTTIFLATLMVIMTLLSDIVYKIVDPKISFE